jgi:succinoglycan biosynthesis transport protein ExoP
VDVPLDRMNQIVPIQQSSGPSNENRWAYTPPLRPSPLDREGTPIDFGRLFGILRRRWWLVALITLVAGASAWYRVRNQPHSYHASAVVQLLDSRNALASGLVKDDNRISAMYMTTSEAEIIRSRAVADVVVDSEPLGLRVNAVGFPNSFLSDVSVDNGVSAISIPLTFTKSGVLVGSTRGEPTPFGMPVSSAGLHFIVRAPVPGITRGALSVTSRDRAADRLGFGLDVSPRKQTSLIDITYTADDRLTAKRIVNSVARAYQTVDTRLAQQQLRRKRIFVEEQLARTDAQLAEADRALSTFRTKQQAYSSQDKFKSQQEALASLDVRREDLDGNRKMATALLRRFETGDDVARKSVLSMLASAPEVSGDQSPVPDLYKRLVGYQQSRAELTSGPSGKASTHPEVLRLDTLIASTQAELLSAARAHVALLDARIEALDEVRTHSASALEQLPAAEAAETGLQQNADALRAQAALLRAEYQQARIAEAAELGQVEIVDLATHAFATQLGRTRFVAFVLFLGFLVGSGIALLLEGADRTVKRRDDVESSLHVPVLGTIPRMNSNDVSAQKRMSGMASLANRKTTASKRRQIALSADVRARSPGAEAFRHLGTSLLYSRPGQPPRRILVTSPGEGDGKTSVASNLAITLAHRRHRVLLVDCDIYGKLHSIFQLPAAPGLAEVVLNEVHPADAIHVTGVPGLSLMTSGTAGAPTTDVIGSDRMRAMLKDMTHEFDIIVLDCSPILALADSTILSVNSDTVLLVVRAGHTAAAAAVEAMRQLSGVGAHVAGVVLNDPEDRARQYGADYPTYSYAGK